MFLVKANTVIKIQVPKTNRWFYGDSWMPYTTKEDKIYDNHEVINAIAVHNDRDDVADWMRRNIVEHNYVVITRNNKFAMVRPTDIEYVD